MIFHESELHGAYIIELDRIEDARGFFARAWSEEEFASHGLETRIAHCNISFNVHTGTLRGLHYQTAPHEETKLIRCTRGSLFDVIIDLRSDSTTYMRWTSTKLSADNRRMFYVPRGFAHGFQTLQDRTEVFYMASEVHVSDSERGVRWNDSSFGIDWPIQEPSVISDKDASWPDYIAGPNNSKSSPSIEGMRSRSSDDAATPANDVEP
jgi:dTDP-4-dehydrorhamnose 3,5-epimerase